MSYKAKCNDFLNEQLKVKWLSKWTTQSWVTVWDINSSCCLLKFFGEVIAGSWFMCRCLEKGNTSSFVHVFISFLIIMWRTCLFWVILAFILASLEYECPWFIAFMVRTSGRTLCYPCLVPVKCLNQNYSCLSLTFSCFKSHVLLSLIPMPNMFSSINTVVWISPVWSLASLIRLWFSKGDWVFVCSK